jgi:tetratricopeptide (TPR) repeat protein
MSGEMTSLQLGIMAIKAHNFEEARIHLIQAISQDPENAEPWLWLGVAAKNLEERIQYLEQAISIEPENARALKILDTLHQQQIVQWIKQGISAIQAGNAIKGVENLAKAVEADENQLEAWWWLGQVSDSPEDKIVCYENVIALDPEHSGAQLALKALKHIEETAVMDEHNLPPDVPLIETQKVESTGDEASTSSELLKPSERVTFNDILDSELLCLFCASPTEASNEKCPQCHRRLYKYQRPTAQPKPQYRIITALECGIFFGGILVVLLMLGYLNMFVSTDHNTAILQAYIAPNNGVLSPNMDIAFSIISPTAFYSALVSALLSVPIIVCILSRWQPLFYSAIGLSTIRILICILTVIHIINGIPASLSIPPTTASGDLFVKQTRYSLIGAAVVVGLLSSAALFQLISTHTLFHREKVRRLLTLDRDVSGSSKGLRQRARVYAKEKAWALAALHARESLFYDIEIEGYTLLATAYYHLGWQDKVTETLEDALAVSPNNTQIIQLREVLAQQME